jgi:hypothetical protein
LVSVAGLDNKKYQHSSKPPTLCANINMQLHPKIGIDNIKFGSNQTEVLNILGEPSNIFSDKDDPNEIIYKYNHLKLSLTFYISENYRLGYIRCSNPETNYKGRKILNLPITKVQKNVFGEFDQNWDVEQYDFFDTYFNESIWLTLNVEYGEVTDVELGVPFNFNDEYDWPL